MSKISLKHSGGNVVSLNSPTNAPSAADVAFKLPNADGSDGQAIVTDGSGNLSFGSVAATRNLIINGAMQVAQRGTSGTDDGYASVDRFRQAYSGTDEAPTQSQVDVASGTTPYSQGFRKAFKITNGNQTSGAGTSDLVLMRHRLEAQNLANSGWNYTSSSSFITLSFWCKSSVAQNFYIRLETSDGTAQAYYMETGSLSADTWTKITKTIPGNSNLQFDNDANTGITIEWVQFYGTDKTGSVSLDSWAAYSNTLRVPDMTSTWYTTNDATFEITGVQLEVGSVATDFEHRSFGQELALCQRYFYKFADGSTGGNYIGIGNQYTSSAFYVFIKFPVNLRAGPSLVQNTTTNGYKKFANSTLSQFNSFTGFTGESDTGGLLYASVSGTAGHACQIALGNGEGGFLAASSEL